MHLQNHNSSHFCGKLLISLQTIQQQYFTAVVVLKQLRMLGILTDLKEEIKLLLHEKGILQMSDSNLLVEQNNRSKRFAIYL